ncbi:MAG: peptidyl-prolyl cis-trans isomerase [Planctomycetes bacterium]|nr:peptidyl-prolyl cis-trans isomerase [Planctomycetota bacterium]
MTTSHTRTFLLILLTSWTATAQTRQIPIEGPRVIVDDQVVTEYDILQYAIDEDLDASKIEVRREILGRLFYAARVKALGSRIEIDEKLIRRNAEMMTMEREKTFGSRSEFLSNLRQHGQSYADYLALRRAELTIQRLEATMMYDYGPTGRPGTDLWIKPKTLRTYFREHQQEFLQPKAIQGARIQFPWSRFETRAAARTAAAEWLAKIQGGETTFVVVAREHSAWNPAGGGELSGNFDGTPHWVDLTATTSLPVEFVSELGKATPGWLGLIESSVEGVSIVRLDAVRPESTKPFADPQVQEAIVGTLREERTRRLQRTYLDRLKEKPYIWPPEYR